MSDDDDLNLFPSSRMVNELNSDSNCRNRYVRIEEHIEEILTAKTVVFGRGGQAVRAAGREALVIRVGADDVPAGPVVAHVQLGVAAGRVVVERVPAPHVRRLAPHQLRKREKIVNKKSKL